MRRFSRLRWQLTLSHLLAIAFTLLSMIAAVLLIAGAWFSSQSSVSRQPANDARNVAAAIGGMVERGADGAQISPVLRSLANGTLHLVVAFPGLERRPGVPAFGLSGIGYLVLLDPNGQVTASSEPSGAAFSADERGEWLSLASTADASGTQLVRQGAAPPALGAAAINDVNGRRLATVVVATTAAPQPAGGGLDLVRGLAIFGAASVALLGAASLFALASASIVAYLLSRRLVARLESLGRAAEALAAGDLSQRVEPGPDEVGQLAGRFNRMAADLDRTLRELRAERDRVAGLLDDRRQLVASASHELRTPLATVRGYVESALGRQDGLPTGLQADLTTIERELGRLQQLIDDLFALSQASVGRLALRLEPTDAGAVVQRLVETTAPLAWRQRRVQVLAEIPEQVCAALADRQRLEQVVSNLLSNAIRHTPPGGLVAAAVRGEAADLVRIEVRDTGSGIAPDDLPRVFERFFRGASGNGDGGAGLGLALVKELTEAMGGRVEVSSQVDEGSSFSVWLPRG